MPSRSSPSTRAPQIEPLQLPRLTSGAAADLVADADLEAMHLADSPADGGGALSLRGARMWGCHLDGVTADEADLGGSRLAEVRLDVARIPVLRAARTDWHDVEVSGRLGSVEAYDARWRSLRVRDAKIDYLNLRGAELTDVELVDCVVGELDLGGAVLRRVALTRTRVDRVDVRRGELHDVDLRQADLAQIDGVADLRGATLSGDQLTLLAPVLAAELGIRVQG